MLPSQALNMSVSRYDKEYMVQQGMIMGGDGVAFDAPLSQSYRRAVLRQPPSPDFRLIVQPPIKVGGNWHYGGRVVPVGGSTSHDDMREYTIWRKWEDCLDLQKLLEKEFAYLSSQRRKRAGKGFYQGGAERGASFESLPSGPEPLSMALDIHQHLPKLSKKTTLFGKPNAELLTHRAEDFKTFIEAALSINTPLMEELRSRRLIRDWFGWWQRDSDGERKAAGRNSTPMPAFASIQAGTVHLPSLIIQKSLASSASSTSGSSSDGRRHSIRTESADGDDLIDNFPMTPDGHNASQFSASTQSASSHHSHSASSHGQSSMSIFKTRSFDSPFSSGYFGISGMMAPVTSRPRSTMPAMQKNSPLSHPGPAVPPPSPPIIKDVEVVETPTPFVAPVVRQRPRSTTANSANRNGRVFDSMDSAPPPIPVAADPPKSPSQTSTPPPRPPRSPDRIPNNSPPTSAPKVTLPPISTETVVARGFRPRKVSVESIGSFVDVKLPYTTSPAEMEAAHVAPALQSRSRSARAGRARHSISSIESYLSDSSIDAAISQMRKPDSKPSPNRGPHRGPANALRRSLSSGASSTRPRMSRVGASRVDSTHAEEQEHGHEVVGRRSVEDEDVVDAYFDSPRPQGAGLTRRSSESSKSLASRQSFAVSEISNSTSSSELRRESVHSSARLASRGRFHLPMTPSSPARSSFMTSSGRSVALENTFNAKVLLPTATDVLAIVCRVPRTISFVELQDKLAQKFEEAEGISLMDLEYGFTIGYTPFGSTPLALKRSSATSSVEESHQRTRSGSITSFGSSDPAKFKIITNEADWEAAIPPPNEKLTMRIFVDEM